MRVAAPSRSWRWRPAFGRRDVIASPRSGAGGRGCPGPVGGPRDLHQHCLMCHSGDQPQAGVSLARLTERMSSADVGEQADTWEKVAEMLETRQMPPARCRGSRRGGARLGGVLDPGRRSTNTSEPRRRSGTGHGPAADERRIRATRSATSPASRSRSASTRRATRWAARASPTSATSSSCRTPASSAISRRPSRSPITRSSASGPLDLLHRSRQDRPRAVGAQPDQRALRDEGLPRRLGRGRPSLRLRALRARRSSWPGTTSTASPSAIRRRPCAASRRRKASPADSPSTSGGRSTDRHRIPEPRHDRRPGEARRRRPRTPRRRSRRRAPAADALTKKLVTWPSWFFARGDLAAGGAGDESPLVFDDTTLTAESDARATPTRSGCRRPADGRGGPLGAGPAGRCT